MKNKISLLQISDLHRGKDSPISNDALLASLISDRTKYTQTEKPTIKVPDIIIVCGDIIRGSDNKENLDEDIHQQYDEAIEFLTGMANEFLDGNKEKIVLVPGNHDVSWKHSIDSMVKIDNKNIIDSNNQLKAEFLKNALNEKSNIRWSWKDLSFYSLNDTKTYDKRLEAFANFYNRFYEGIKSYSLIPEDQYEIFDFPELSISIVGFNSCYNNDHLKRVGDIHPDCIANSMLKLKKLTTKGRLLLSAWHHNTKGSPYDADYMDSSKLQNFIQADIALGFHGHQHRTEVVQEYNNTIEQKRIIVFSSGTLCGAPGELPTGQNQQYNIIEIDPAPETDKNIKVTLHAREKTATSSFDNPIWTQGRIDSINVSCINVSIPKPLQPTLSVSLLEVETLIKEKQYIEARQKLLALDLNEPFVRSYLLSVVVETEDCDTAYTVFNPPRSSAEAVSLLSLLLQRNYRVKMAECIEQPSIKDSSDPTVSQLRSKIEDYLS